MKPSRRRRKLLAYVIHFVSAVISGVGFGLVAAAAGLVYLAHSHEGTNFANGWHYVFNEGLDLYIAIICAGVLFGLIFGLITGGIDFEAISNKISPPYDGYYKEEEYGRTYWYFLKPENPTIFHRIRDTLFMMISCGFAGMLAGAFFGFLLSPIIWPIVRPLWIFIRNHFEVFQNIGDIVMFPLIGLVIGVLVGLIMGIVGMVEGIYRRIDVTPQPEPEPGGEE